MRQVGIAVVALALAGCGFHPTTYVSALDIATRLHMTHCVARSGVSAGATSEVDCTEGTVDHFMGGLRGLNEANWRSFAKYRNSGDVVIGDSFAIQCRTVQWCINAEHTVGGKLY